MPRKQILLAVCASTALGAALTGFYFIHEGLPRAIRAPTSLILAPVAIVDGLCYFFRLPGIYGKPIPIFAVNSVSGFGIWFTISFFLRRWHVRHPNRR